MDLIKIMRRKTSEKQLGLNANKATPDVTALYERLSRDDDREGESNSIVNQKALLENYAQEHGFTNIRHYTDDGYSGGDFDRPGWDQLIRDIEAGIVKTVIAKDMSRIGRTHIDTGFYTEIFFPRMDIHFIAVNNNVDSDIPETMEYTGFMNILNEWYLRDQSRKMKQSIHLKARSGKPVASVPPFGYTKDPSDVNHWIIDPEAAGTVRYIFNLACQGCLPAQIARRLREEHYEAPGYYLAQRGRQNYSRWGNTVQPYDWTTKRVIQFIRREEYKGWTVNLRKTKPDYHSPAVVQSRDQWLIFKNTHEAIVSEQIWEQAQQALRNTHKNEKHPAKHPLAGLVFCAGCGKRMHFAQSKSDSVKQNKSYFQCSDYVAARNREIKRCASNYVSPVILRGIVSDVIRQVCHAAAFDEEALRQLFQQTKQLNESNEQKELAKRLRKAEKRIAELDHLLKTLYENYALGHISEVMFDTLSAEYEAEQAVLKKTLPAGKARLSQMQSDTENLDRFIALARQYHDCTEVTDEMIKAFIDKVIVYRTEKDENGHRTRRIDIYFSFIGKIDLSGAEPKADNTNANEQHSS